MEARNSDNGHVIEVRADVSASDRGSGGIKACEGATCGFSVSKDAQERSASVKKLVIAVVLCIIFMSVEVVGGIKLANSLAILTDAAHLLSDVASFAISLFSIWAAGWEATPRQSYGFFRIEILGALVSIQLIWLLTGILVYEAIVRLLHNNGDVVDGMWMFLVSAFGLVVNLIMALLLGHDHGHDQVHEQEEEPKHDEHHHHMHGDVPCEPLLINTSTSNEDESTSNNGAVEVAKKKKKQRNINVQGAYLHVLGDTIQSVGVMIGGAIIWNNLLLELVV